MTPRLRAWWTSLRQRFRPPRRLKFTRAGRVYVGFTLAMGFAAISSGNNLLFLLLGLMLAGITLSGVLSESTLRGLTVSRSLPLEAQAGQPVLVGLTVTNHKKRFSSFAVVGRDVTDRGVAGRVFALHLDPRQTRNLAYRWEPDRRGRVKFARIEVATRYPFGLFEKWREYFVEAEMVVFPREVPAPPVAPRRAHPPGERPAGAIGQGSEFFALREARFGDDARHLHWKTTARIGRPVVVEREKERRRRVAIVADNRAPGPSTALRTNGGGALRTNGGGALRTSGIEEAMDDLAERAAALVKKSMMEGCEVALSASGVLVPPGIGSAHERRILRELALLEAARDDAAPQPIPHAELVPVAVEVVGGPAA